MTCPDCGELMTADLEKLGRRAARFPDYAFRCDACGTAYSNARNPGARKLIRLPERNVPEPVRRGLVEALAGAVNVKSRPQKALKFGSQNSEDAVTWTVFRGLESTVGLDALARACGEGSAASGSPSLVLWGHPISGAAAPEMARALAEISSELGENPNLRSEPDAIVAWDPLLIVTEAKLFSPNERKPGAAGFGRYFSRPELFSVDTAKVRESGYYELVRNWVIGVLLAARTGRRHFVLVNLGGANLGDDCAALSSELAASPRRHLVHLRWADLLEGLSLPDWFEEYVTQMELRGL